MKNKPILINNIDDFHKFFGKPDNSLLLKIRRIKIERIKQQIGRNKKLKYKYIKTQDYEEAAKCRDIERDLLDQLEMFQNK